MQQNAVSQVSQPTSPGSGFGNLTSDTMHGNALHSLRLSGKCLCIHSLSLFRSFIIDHKQKLGSRKEGGHSSEPILNLFSKQIIVWSFPNEYLSDFSAQNR